MQYVRIPVLGRLVRDVCHSRNTGTGHVESVAILVAQCLMNMAIYRHDTTISMLTAMALLYDTSMTVDTLTATQTQHAASTESATAGVQKLT